MARRKSSLEKLFSAHARSFRKPRFETSLEYQKKNYEIVRAEDVERLNSNYEWKQRNLILFKDHLCIARAQQDLVIEHIPLVEVSCLTVCDRFWHFLFSMRSVEFPCWRRMASRLKPLRATMNVRVMEMGTIITRSDLSVTERREWREVYHAIS